MTAARRRGVDSDRASAAAPGDVPGSAAAGV